MNALKELLEHIKGRPVRHIRVIHGELIEGTLDEVLPRFNFEYDNGFGRQEIEGTIWYEDGTWSDRREYDGSEWWEHHVCPPLPNVRDRRYLPVARVAEELEQENARMRESAQAVVAAQGNFTGGRAMSDTPKTDVSELSREPTMHLRWENGTLKQMWEIRRLYPKYADGKCIGSYRDSKNEWIPVHNVSEHREDGQ